MRCFHFTITGILILFSIGVFGLMPTDAYAEEIDVTSFALDETTIIEVENNSKNDISSFRVWLGGDSNFKSFKTENNWTGKINSQGVLVFISSESIKSGESVKFGVKTDKVSSGINWKALDKSDEQLATSKVLSKDIPEMVKKTTPSKEDTTQKTITQSISSDSTFRIVPEKPNVGSTIRVVGEKFGASQDFDFYIDSKKLGSFQTDKDGNFITTMKIPQDQKADRTDFQIKNKDGKEKKISLRIGSLESLVFVDKNIQLTVKGFPDVIYRGDFLEISGTGTPRSAITVEITNPEGNTLNSRTAEIDNKGNWKLEEPVIIQIDAPFGKYSATITDGRQNIEKKWSIETDKVIIITPTSLKFETGETMKFTGIALPNKSIELILEDPFGKEVYSDISQTNVSGQIEFEFPTNNNLAKGTYTLIATQEKEKEFIFAGLGVLPTIPVNLEFDKLNYKNTEKAKITLVGKPSEIISLLIIDPSDNPKGDPISVKLKPDGRGEHTLDLKGYTSGVYSAVINKGSAQSKEVFAIGLQTGSGEIEIKTTKTDYLPGDSILILGDTDKANSLLTFTLTDPDGNEIKVKETFSDKNAKISESSFKIPSAGKIGIWEIKVTSGPNFTVAQINVLATLEVGMQIMVNEGVPLSGYGKTITIKVVGANQTVEIDIVAADGKIIDSLSFPSSSKGLISQPWIIPKDMVPGIYTFKAVDAFDSSETTFEFK